MYVCGRPRGEGFTNFVHCVTLSIHEFATSTATDPVLVTVVGYEQFSPASLLCHVHFTPYNTVNEIMRRARFVGKGKAVAHFGMWMHGNALGGFE